MVASTLTDQLMTLQIRLKMVETRFCKCDIPLETSAPRTAETNELCSLVLSIIEVCIWAIYYFSVDSEVIDLEILRRVPEKSECGIH